MIFYLIIMGIITIIGAIFGVLPQVTTLPYIDQYIVDGVSYYKLLAALFPPFATGLTVFLLYLSFRIGLILLKVILGSRTPTHT